MEPCDSSDNTFIWWMVISQHEKSGHWLCFIIEHHIYKNDKENQTAVWVKSVIKGKDNLEVLRGLSSQHCDVSFPSCFEGTVLVCLAGIKLQALISESPLLDCRLNAMHFPFPVTLLTCWLQNYDSPTYVEHRALLVWPFMALASSVVLETLENSLCSIHLHQWVKCLRGDMWQRKPAPDPDAELWKIPSSSSSWVFGGLHRQRGWQPWRCLWLCHVTRLLTVLKDSTWSHFPLTYLWSSAICILLWAQGQKKAPA